MKSTLRSGTSVSHYRVLAPLAAGGMGEVYKAEDTTLDRTIALKILPPELVKNEERVRRFIQEAKSASSLSHPNIITVHEIGEAVVQSDGELDASAPETSSVLYIAMELVDGDTIRTKIHEHKTALPTLLGYFAQAAEGLAKAHAAGIVHRDLKPDNIMVTRDGYAKVLDFGLAKLAEAPGVSESATSTTRPARVPTRAGAVLGTVGYMSPEQIQGRPVDHRSDIFSFGCILYEAATGQRPFEADSDIDVMHRIIHDKPAPIDELNPAAPAELRGLIRRCLAKDLDRRYQSMKDLALELADIANEYKEQAVSATGSIAGGSTLTMVPRARGRRVGRRIVITVLGAAAVALAILGVHAVVQHRGGGKGPTRFDSMRITSLTGSGNVRTAAISPDGKVVVQAVESEGKQSLWIHQVATASDVEIVPPGPRFRGLTFSPDGNYVYYTRSERDLELYSLLYQIPVFGGTPRKLIFDIDTQITLSPDGKQLAFVRGYPVEGESAVMVASADGTGERKLAVRKRPDQFELTGAAWSPDGETIVAVASSLEGGIHRSLVAVDVGSGEQRRIGAQRWARIEGLAWLPDQSGIVIAGIMDASNLVQQIWLVSHPDGQVRRVTNDLNSYSSVSLTHDSRSLITVRTNAVSNLWVVPVDGGSSPLQLTSGRQEFIDEVRWSRAGPIAFRAFRNDTRDLWLCAPDGSSSTQLTSGLPLDGEPVLADDGSFVLCTSSRQGGVPHVWKLDPDGSNATRVTDGAGEVLADVSPDGSWFLYRSLGPEGGLWKMSVGGGDARCIVDQGREFALLSRDGRYMAYARLVREGNRFVSTLAIIPAEGGEVVASLVAEEGTGEGRWGPSNDMVSYVLTRDGVANIWVLPIKGGPAKQITRFDSRLIFSFDWSPDRKQLAVSRGEVLGDVVMLSDFR